MTLYKALVEVYLPVGIKLDSTSRKGLELEYVTAVNSYNMTTPRNIFVFRCGNELRAYQDNLEFYIQINGNLSPDSKINTSIYKDLYSDRLETGIHQDKIWLVPTVIK